MKIKNAKIKNVTQRLENGRLVVNMEFHYMTHFKIFVFNLANPVEMKNFTKLMEFAEVRNFGGLEGKTIRVAEYHDFVIAVGHPIEDRFVNVTNTMVYSVEELSESELFKEYPKSE